jgi:hypothetical protein
MDTRHFTCLLCLQRPSGREPTIHHTSILIRIEWVPTSTIQIRRCAVTGLVLRGINVFKKKEQLKLSFTNRLPSFPSL